jgi:hypothetical protein
MHPLQLQNLQRVTRRHFLGQTGTGIGCAALAHLLTQDLTATAARAARSEPGLELANSQPPRGLPGVPHFPPQAKRVIVMWQGGGPSHVDLFDEKSMLAQQAGSDIPDSIRGTTRLSTMSSGYAKWPCQPAIKPFRSYGESGLRISSMLPNLGNLADELCVVRSLHTEAVNHAPGVTFFMTGAQIPGRPSLGAWLTYGLGSESEDLPAFVVMTSSDKAKTCGQLFFDYYWGSGFIPSRHQGVRFQNTGDLVPYLANPHGIDPIIRRDMLDELAILNRKHLAEYGDPEIDTRIAQYEMAFRMQTSPVSRDATPS